MQITVYDDYTHTYNIQTHTNAYTQNEPILLLLFPNFAMHLHIYAI